MTAVGLDRWRYILFCVVQQLEPKEVLVFLPLSFVREKLLKTDIPFFSYQQLGDCTWVT